MYINKKEGICMMKKLLSFSMVVLLTLTLVQTAFAEDNHVCNLNTSIEALVSKQDIYDSKSIPGYYEENKGEMNGEEELFGVNPYIKITQEAESKVATVHYINSFVVNGLNYELKYFYYKAGNDNIFTVTFDTPLKVGECAQFNLGFALNGSDKLYQPAVSHFVTVDSGFVPPTPAIEYTKETAWAVDNRSNTLSSIIGPKKWGWYLEAKEGIFNVYAGAGQNDLSKGTLIGTVTVSVDNGFYKAEFTGYGAHKVEGMHFGVYDTLEALKATGGAPGQFTSKVSDANAKYMVIHFDALVAK
jgi:hypothetical protein